MEGVGFYMFYLPGDPELLFYWIICDNRIISAECRCLRFLGNDVDESDKIVRPSVQFGALEIDPLPRKL